MEDPPEFPLEDKAPLEEIGDPPNTHASRRSKKKM